MESKERLAIENLYLEDEIRLDHNIGNMVGEAPAFQTVLKRIQTVAPTAQPFSSPARQARAKNSSRGPFTN